MKLLDSEVFELSFDVVLRIPREIDQGPEDTFVVVVFLQTDIGDLMGVADVLMQLPLSAQLHVQIDILWLAPGILSERTVPGARVIIDHGQVSGAKPDDLLLHWFLFRLRPMFPNATDR